MKKTIDLEGETGGSCCHSDVTECAMLATARNFRVQQMPNGSAFGCGTCHTSAGGRGPRNSFGQAVGAIVGGPSSTAFWSPTLAALDSDGDGTANGLELGDPEATATPAIGYIVQVGSGFIKEGDVDIAYFTTNASRTARAALICSPPKLYKLAIGAVYL